VASFKDLLEIRGGGMSEVESIDYEDELGDGESTAIPLGERVLRTQAYDKSVGDLVTMVKAGEIVLDPDYQRNYIWENSKASLLVESFLLNVPIPIIYVSEESDGRWSVVDGLQRLTSLRRFFDDEFKLSKLEVFQELNGIPFSKLPPKAQRTLKNGILRIIVMLQESHPEIKYDIFQRLNRGSIRLNEQELRNCLYRGEMTNALRESRKDKVFLGLIGLKAPHPRFNDEELILRCLAMAAGFEAATGTMPSYPNKMKSFLNSFMESHNKATQEQVRAIMDKFNEVVSAIEFVLGSKAFRRPLGAGGLTDSRLNRALMDGVFVAFWHLPLSSLKDKAGKLRGLNEHLVLSDPAFSDALIYGTSDKKRLEYRVKRWYFEAKEIIER
jgi:hypothetical protein